MEAAIAPKGQAAMPKPVREHLGLERGDRVTFFHPDGGVVLLPKRPASALRGLVGHRGRPVTLGEMDEAVAERAFGKAR